jgi:hypothetical protein
VSLKAALAVVWTGSIRASCLLGTQPTPRSSVVTCPLETPFQWLLQERLQGRSHSRRRYSLLGIQQCHPAHQHSWEMNYALLKDDVSSIVLIWRRMKCENRAVGSVGNASGRTRFELRPGHQLSLQSVYVNFLSPSWQTSRENREIFKFIDRFTALRFTATGPPLAVRGIRILPMNQLVWWPITFGMKGGN